jgi:hypothetical protein
MPHTHTYPTSRYPNLSTATKHARALLHATLVAACRFPSYAPKLLVIILSATFMSAPMSVCHELPSLPPIDRRAYVW